jgi:hypothetical protein
MSFGQIKLTAEQIEKMPAAQQDLAAAAPGT